MHLSESDACPYTGDMENKKEKKKIFSESEMTRQLVIIL